MVLWTESIENDVGMESGLGRLQQKQKVVAMPTEEAGLRRAQDRKERGYYVFIWDGELKMLGDIHVVMPMIQLERRDRKC